MNFFASLRSRLGSWAIVVLLVIGLAGWMVSGAFSDPAQDPAQDPAASGMSAANVAPFEVAVRNQHALPVARQISLNGETQPDQVINIAAEVEGQVLRAGPRKGAQVSRGTVLARIDGGTLVQQRIEAIAIVRTRELEYLAAKTLGETGHVTEADVASRLAALETARTAQAEIEQRLEKLVITSPVNGRLEARLFEAGDYVKIGTVMARVIRIDPLVVSVDVNESEIGSVKVGATATVNVFDDSFQGRVRYVAALSDGGTRTFGVEIEIPNPDGALPAGVSARVSIPLDIEPAHRVPASLLALADDGTLGVKHVVDGKVVFTPARILRADGDAVFVAGLPDRIQLITRGQGFVTDGQQVAVQSSDGAAAAAHAAGP